MKLLDIFFKFFTGFSALEIAQKAIVIAAIVAITAAWSLALLALIDNLVTPIFNQYIAFGFGILPAQTVNYIVVILSTNIARFAYKTKIQAIRQLKFKF